MFSFFTFLFTLPYFVLITAVLYKPSKEANLPPISNRNLFVSMILGAGASAFYLWGIGTRVIPLEKAKVVSTDQVCDFLCLGEYTKVTLQTDNSRYVGKLPSQSSIAQGDRINGVIEKDIFGIVDTFHYIQPLQEASIVASEIGQSTTPKD